jgi:hypothetical protein
MRAQRKWPQLSSAQKRKLMQWIAEGQQWILSRGKAIETIRDYLKTTEGHAQKLLKDAEDSGEVQCVRGDAEVFAWDRDDLIAPPSEPSATPQSSLVRPKHIHPRDVPLIEEGGKLVR